MKVCPLCGENYQPFIDFCFVDGEVLTVEDAAIEPPEPEGFDAPPPPKMLQGSQQSSGYTRSATPVPRVRREGRSLINRPEGGGGVYSPPAEEPVAPDPADAPAPVASSNLADDEDEVLEAPPMVDEVEEVAAFDPGFGEEEVPEPQPEPILGNAPRSSSPAPLPKRDTPRPAAPIAPPEEEEREAGAMGLVMIGLGAVVLIGVVGAIGALAAGAIFSGSKDDTQVVAVPTPLPDPPPVPSQPEPVEPSEPVQVGPVQPEPVDPDPVQPDPVQPDPVPVQPDPVPVQPDPVQPDPVPVQPDPNDGVTVVEPLPTPVAKTGSVFFQSDPKQARITVDGNTIGTTPFTTTFRYGRHDLKLEKDGYAPLTTQFNVEAPDTQLPSYTLDSLTPEPAPEPEVPVPTSRPTGDPRRVMIFFSEQGVPIKVNGSTQGCEMVKGQCVTPATFGLAPGEYTVEYFPGGDRKTCRIVIPPGTDTKLTKLHEECP